MRCVVVVFVVKCVVEEMGVEIGKEVGYLVCFEDRMCCLMRIKYLIDGTLLREFFEDSILSRYSVVVLDEVYEWLLYIDILFGLLKKFVFVCELKLVIILVTFDSEKFSTYFDDVLVFIVFGCMFLV